MSKMILKQQLKMSILCIKGKFSLTLEFSISFEEAQKEFFFQNQIKLSEKLGISKIWLIFSEFWNFHQTFFKFTLNFVLLWDCPGIEKLAP